MEVTRLPRGAAGLPLECVVFVSGGGGNLAACLEVQRERPELVHVGLVVSDRPGTRAAELARDAAVPVTELDFSGASGLSAVDRANASERRHDELLDRLRTLELERGRRFDLAVLSYRRWIHGRLLDRFRDAMINQHPADLDDRDAHGNPRFVGLHGVADALRAGRTATRTTNFLVDDSHDRGPVLARGPWTVADPSSVGPTDPEQHELRQKRVSDWPLLGFVLVALAEGRFGITAHDDAARRTVWFDGAPLGPGGVDWDDLNPGPTRRTRIDDVLIPSTRGRSR